MHSVLPDLVPPHAPMSHRKIIRFWLPSVVRPSTARALFLVALDIVLFGLSMAATVWFQRAGVKLVFGLVAGFIIGWGSWFFCRLLHRIVCGTSVITWCITAIPI